MRYRTGCKGRYVEQLTGLIAEKLPSCRVRHSFWPRSPPAVHPTLAPILGLPVPTHAFLVALGVLVGGATSMRLGTWLQPS